MVLFVSVKSYVYLDDTSLSHYGGRSDGVPPLPIPNREVKPVSADGTAMQCGRVGRRLFLSDSPEGSAYGDAGSSFFVFVCHSRLYLFFAHRMNIV